MPAKNSKNSKPSTPKPAPTKAKAPKKAPVKKDAPKKKVVKTSPATKAPAPAPAPEPAPAPVAEPAVEPAPAPVAEPSVEPVEAPAPVPEPVLCNYDSQIDSLESGVKSVTLILKSLTSELSALRKQVSKDRRVVEKKMKTKGRRNNGEKVMNGFSKPGPVSDELRKFFTLGKEDLIARTEVTKKITEYCQQNKLQNEKDKRIILPDKALSKLLRIKKGEELTYFNLQKYMKIHFPNKEGVYPTAA